MNLESVNFTKYSHVQGKYIYTIMDIVRNTSLPTKKCPFSLRPFIEL